MTPSSQPSALWVLRTLYNAVAPYHPSWSVIMDTRDFLEKSPDAAPSSPEAQPSDKSYEAVMEERAAYGIPEAQPGEREQELMRELVSQWADNHAEHCGFDPWIHEPGCSWPLPSVIAHLTNEQIDALLAGR